MHTRPRTLQITLPFSHSILRLHARPSPVYSAPHRLRRRPIFLITTFYPPTEATPKPPQSQQEDHRSVLAMPNCLIDHPLVQDTNNTAPRWSRFFGDTISEWIESAVQEWKDDTKRNGHFKMSFWGCFDPIDLCKFSRFNSMSNFRVRMQDGERREQGEAVRKY